MKTNVYYIDGLVVERKVKQNNVFWIVVETYMCVWPRNQYFVKQPPRDCLYTEKQNSSHVGLSCHPMRMRLIKGLSYAYT